MKLGISYNLFDGFELLQHSLLSVRKCANYIVVVYQKVSNFGNPADPQLYPTLMDMREIGLVDEIIAYTPNNIGHGHPNEVAKRNIGLEACLKNGCSHFISCDCDELYVHEQLEFAMSTVEAGDFDSSACQMFTYYKRPTMVLDPPEEYHVPLIYRLDGRRFDMRNVWPVVKADPTRRLEQGRMRVFTREEIEMHHFSYVRKDLMSKLQNSSASRNFGNRVNNVYTHWKNWQPGQKAFLAGREERWYDLREVPNLFNITDI